SAIRAFGGEGSTLPPVEYQFSFALEGGAFVGGFTPPPSPASIITLPTAAQVSKSGYSLTGWRNQGGTDFAPGQMIALSSATTFTAQWAAPIDLTFALEGGAFAGGFTPPPSQVPAGSSITLPTAEQVSKNGYVLIGWRNQSGQDFTLGQTVALTASTTFTAQWSNIISISRVRVNSWESAGSDRFIPNSLFDNAPNTFWHARWSTGSGHGRGESLVDIDLGGVHTVNRIEVDRRLVSGQDIRAVRMFTHIGQGGEFPNGERIPANFPANVPQADIDLDFVMTGWTEIGDQARQITGLNTSNTVILTLNAPITARYIRLGIENGPVSGDPDFTQVREIRVFGESGGATSIRNRENSDNRFGILLENAIVSDVARISVITPEPATINLRIMDILGNVVFAETAAYGRVAYGRVSNPPLQNDNAIVWNLTNQSGRFVANGTYLIIVEATGSNGRVWHYRAIMGVRR
ncbi:MAG: discoidin domain-containing protein, partial [Chitinivibrionia bacterium]|nr:discoidin domain-containing protein [Chitinivibrionia bacterium]